MLQWLRERYMRKIQFRLTVYFLLILLPLVVVSLYANIRSQSILLERTVERTEAALQSSMDYLEETLQNAEEVTTLISADAAVQQAMKKITPQLDAISYITFANLMKQFSTTASINHVISQVSLFHTSSEMLLTTNHGGKKVTNKAVLQSLRAMTANVGTGTAYIMPEVVLAPKVTFGETMKTDSISLIRAMDVNNPDREGNLLVISLSKQKLLEILETLLPSSDAQILLYTNKRELIASFGHEILPLSTTNTDVMLASNLEGDAQLSGIFSIVADSRFYKWRLQLLQAEDQMFQEINEIKWFTYLIIMLSMVLAVLIAWAVYLGIAAPIQRLWRGMNVVGSGNFNVRLENKRMDEIGFLTRSFNKMVEEQQNLIENHYEQQLRQANTELKFLQSQINPHFLYNTLDSIYWTAENYEATEISEMVLHLSRFFRLSLHKGRETFTVEETVDHIHHYIRIQQLRFLDSFEVIYAIELETKSIPVLKLLLQPLVENAILHGLESRDGGCLWIKSRLEQSFLVLTVQDNGAGIAEDRLVYIREQLERLSDFTVGPLTFLEENMSNIFGLRNVYARIKLFYGREAQLCIESTLGSGTMIEMYLPLEQCYAEHPLESKSREK
ncbi:sensor histidine kinase [Paenibacillus yanchengensis]|uniref:Sensor histidine kinase n=1 Tax=Paenibacillus yanchengensis TaxID=2035833 RepID=A0ABW4YET2_9BACL